MRCAFGEQLGGRHPQRDVGVPDLGLGTGDALADRGLGLQQCAGDLRHGQPGNQPQGQRELRYPVEGRVGAGEHHPQFVIANGMGFSVIGARPDVLHIPFHGRQFFSRTD